MIPTSYADIVALTILAIGAALTLGTGAALWRYRRTGLFPGQSTEDATASSGADVRGAQLRLTLGVLLTAAGVIAVLAV